MSPQILEGRFDLEKQISRTDFITVYLARDRHYLHRPHCLVKAINYRQAHMRHRIEREVHTLEHLGAHPQIPNVLAYFHGEGHEGNEGKTVYIAQDLIEGHPLSQEITAGKPLSESYASKLLKDVLVPLSRVHAQGVVHQSLHPLHLIRREQDGQIFLTEFGTLPKLARSNLDEAGQLTSSVPVSPQPYSAPEQLLQNPQPASDLYALGLIAIEALTGRRHQDLTFDPVKGLVWRDLVKTGDGIDGALSLSLAEFIDRLVRHDWRDRFKNAEEALALLRVVQGRNQVANDSRFPTVVAAPGKQATAFSKTAQTTPMPASPRNNLPYPLNLAVRGNHPSSQVSAKRGSSRSPYSASSRPQYPVKASNLILLKWAIASIAVVSAIGIGVKAYQWGEYRISRLPQSWSEWAVKSGDGRAVSGYPAADPEMLAPVFEEGSLLLQPAAVKAYWQMSAAAATEGIKLYPLSGYQPLEGAVPASQPIDTQAAKAQAESDVPRTTGRQSDYHTGYALDIGGEAEATDRQPAFAKTEAYRWLVDNAEQYGFELSSPVSPFKKGLLGAASDQPWHWRYVGDEASQSIFGNSSQENRS